MMRLRMHRATARRVRVWFPWVFAALCATLAVASLVGRVISSQLEGSEAAIAARLGDMTGFEVELAGIRGRFLGWDPVLEIDGLALSKGGVEVLRLRRGRVELDMLETAVRGHAVASALVVEDALVELERGPGGGFRLRRGRGGAAPDPEPIVSFLYHSDYVDVRAAELHLHEADTDADVAPFARVRLRGGLSNEAFSHHGHLRVELTANDLAPASGELHLELDGYPLDPRTRAGTFVLDVREVDLGTVKALAGEASPPLSGVFDRVRLRFEIDPETGTDFSMRLSAARIGIEGEAPLRVRNFRADLEGHGHSLRNGDLRARELRAIVGDESLAFDGARLGWRPTAPQGRRWYLEVGALDAGGLARLARASARLGPRAEEWVTRLDPEADIVAAHAFYDEARATAALAVDTRALRLRAFKGVPSVRGVSARGVLFAGGAWIDIDSDTFYLRFPGIFDEGWRYDRAVGRINLRFDPAGLQILSDRVRIAGPQGRATARFALHLPPEEEARRLTLVLGLADADAAFTEAFLPTKLNPGLRNWLRDAVRAGRVNSGALVINGAVKPSRPLERSLAMAFDLRAGRLAFDPDWPPATSLDASIGVGSDGVRGRIAGGRLAGLEIGGARLRVPNGEGVPPQVEIEGRGRGDGGTALEFLRRAPLGPGLDFLDDGWEASGPVDFEFDIAVPLDGRPLEMADVDTEFALDRLRIGQADLELEQLTGRLAYRHTGFLTSADVQGRLFGGDMELRLAGNFEADADGLLVEGRGTARGRALADWLSIDVLARLAGSTDYETRMRVRPDGTVDVDVRGAASEPGVSGLVTNLPPPLEAPETALEVHVLVVPEAPLDVRLTWGELAAHVQIVDGGLERGALGLDAPLPELPALGLAGLGHAPAMEVSTWLAAIDRWQQDAIVLSRAGAEREELLLDIAVDIDDARWGEQRFGAASMRLAGFTNEMTLGFEAERVAGRIVIPEGDDPLEVRLDRLDFPLDPEAARAQAASAGAEESAGPPVDAVEPVQIDDVASTPRKSLVMELLTDVDPAVVPDLDLDIVSFSDSGEDLGRARFGVRPFGDGLRLVDIDAAGRGLAFGPDAQGRATVELGLVPWPGTRIVGRLSGEDAEAVFERFGLAPVLDAETFAFDLDLAWEGPLDVPELDAIEGTVDLDVRRGRFAQIDAGTGPLRVVGLLNFSAIARRLRLDFSDVFQRGVAFEEIDGRLTVADGRLSTEEAITVEGPGSRFVMTGDLGVVDRSLDAELVVTLPVSSALPWYAAYAALVANPLAGAGVIVAERIFRDQIEKYSSARYRISGTLDAPEVVFDTIFENEMSDAAVAVGDDADSSADPASAAGGASPDDETPLEQ